MCWIGCSWLAGEPVTRQVETRRDPDVLWALANDPQPARSKQLLQGVMLVWLEAVHDFVRALIADVADPALQSWKTPQDQQRDSGHAEGQRILAIGQAHAQRRDEPDRGGGGQADHPPTIAQDDPGAQEADAADDVCGDARPTGFSRDHRVVASEPATRSFSPR